MRACGTGSCGYLTELTRVGEVTHDRGRSGHGRTDEVGAPAGALPPLEVAVRGRCAALARREHVRVHAEAHRAAGAAPFEACVDEDPVEPLGFGLELHLRRARH